MNITEAKKKVKLYDNLQELIFRAIVLNSSGNQIVCDKVLRQLQFIMGQMDVSEYLDNFEQFQVERKMLLSNPDADLSEVRNLAN